MAPRPEPGRIYGLPADNGTGPETFGFAGLRLKPLLRYCLIKLIDMQARSNDCRRRAIGERSEPIVGYQFGSWRGCRGRSANPLSPGLGPAGASPYLPKFKVLPTGLQLGFAERPFTCRQSR